ncbi:uncharacterized protein Z518_06520 [Rhinocladiella mackenziei CBS 650.93]|uniref:C2H2-type domain-containing protein n=1 Tax=Rhinocladiella mackenziei CBS 650.93 TaxID=1442369 RepID=A0A0D2J247_9EURO|nr:uncharacterized protein Z518_06520 [Rhinocladiella mackenziei CBS 650.93]KIX02970.1 hypothetical protein Z518_06520 [Rhinocladiella mackenziei CBS 650.93]
MSSRQTIRKYVCPRCDRSYGKAEHLIRHERSHTGSRPFVCERCNRSFTRADSLARHARRHPSEASRNTPRAPPGRSTTPRPERTNTVPPPHNASDPTVPSESSSNPYEPISDFQTTSEAASLDNDPFGSLNWPDSANLLTSILSAEFTSLPSLDGLPSQSVFRGGPELPSDPVSPWATLDMDQSLLHGGNHAVHHLSQMINTLSADVTSEAQGTGFTSVFLDGCLHMFFTQFLPSFPVVHAPTFVFKDWTHPLLLNAIALGSLFVGKKDYLAKGEVLWRLAHTAVATSWHTLIKHRGPFDSCHGIQLVLTALLGQVYATLSQNASLRMTAQVFHSLGFYWARETGMYDIEEDDDRPALDPGHATDAIEYKWRVWAAKETQLRALLGHYILDGQISEYNGGPTCQRHTSHSLPMPADDSLFEAKDASTWMERARLRRRRPPPFSRLFTSIFSENVHVRHLGKSLSLFTASITLEGLKSLVAEKTNAGSTMVGVPSSFDISRALGRLYAFIMQSTSMSGVAQKVALLRWHTIGLDVATDFSWLCRNLCRKYSVEQRIVGGRTTPALNLESWVHSPRARQALLHATCIQRILQELPNAQAQMIHVPVAIFSAGIIYCAFLLGGVSSMAVPETEEWESVLLMKIDAPFHVADQELDADVRQYLTGSFNGTQKNQNILYDINLFSTSLKSLTQLWGVSAHMQRVLDQLSSLCI